MTDALQWKKPCRPCSGSNHRSQSAVAGVGCEDSGWRILEGTKGGASEATLRPRGRNRLWPRRPHLQHSPEPARHCQRKRGAARASGEVRASRPPLRRFAAPGPLPASLRRAGAGTGLHLPGSAARAAVQPAETTSQPGRRPGSSGTRVGAEPGRREAPHRLDSAPQVSVRRRLGGLHLGKLCFACRLPGGGRRARSPGPGPPCAPPGIRGPWEPAPPAP